MRRGLLVLFFAACAGGTVARAQLVADRPSRPGDFYSLTGVILDSLRKRPLAGADVIIAGTTLNAVTDSIGRFSFDSIPPGDHKIGFFHPFLDSLSVAVAPLTFAIPLEPGVAVVLAIPSASTLMRAVCQTDSVEGKSLLLGKVTDPETGQPLPGASVIVTWTDFSVIKDKAIDRRPQTIQGSADATGAYRVCGVPAEVEAVAYATRDSVQTSRIPISSAGTTVILRNLLLENPATTSGRKASLTGRVVNADGEPVASASVSLAGTSRSTQTDARGQFSLTGLPLGTQSVTVRRIGFAPATIPVDLTSTGSHRIDAKLEKYALAIDPLYVIAQRDRGLERIGFTDRRKRGIGSYRTRSEFQRDNPTYLSDILGKMRGIRVDNAGGRRVIRAMGAGSECVALMIDGLLWEPPTPGEFDESIFPEHVAAIEVYSGASVPPQFEGILARGCTSIVIWTRTRVKDFVEKPSSRR